MTQFKHISDAIQYRKICPLCMGEVSVDYFTKIEHCHNYGKSTITWETKSEKIVANLFTNEIEDFILKKEYDTIFGINAHSTYQFRHSNSNVLNGITFLRLILNCTKCEQYDCIFQVHIDIKNNKIFNIVLNSESIAIEDHKKTHEITSSYALNKTEYTYFETGDYLSTVKYIDLPFIPIDITNPHNTLNRIQSLIVFS